MCDHNLWLKAASLEGLSVLPAIGKLLPAYFFVIEHLHCSLCKHLVGWLLFIMASHGQDLVNMIPDLLSRMRAVETRLFPKLQAQVNTIEDATNEIRRRMGDEGAMSLKGRRAFARDEEK